MKTQKKPQNLSYKSTEIPKNTQRAESLLPHMPPVRNNTGVFSLRGYNRDTLNKRDFSKPKVCTDNPKKWFIYYNFKVPKELADQYPRGWKQFKVYRGINRVPLEERHVITQEIIDELYFAMKHGIYNPFIKEIEEIAEVAEVRRDDMLCRDVFELFMQSRRDRKLDRTSIVAYQATVDWLLTGVGDIPAGALKYTDIDATINRVAHEQDRMWGATTINKEWDFVTTIMNWMESQDYVTKNPCKGKVIRLPVDKTGHKWYDRELATRVKIAVHESKTPWLINVCQFTYEVLIRSKQELRSIRVGDIDMELRRVNFRKEWTKNSSDQSRDYSDAFHELIIGMKLDELPKDWYIFGKGGKPGPVQCGHNYFSNAWSEIRDEMGIGEEYTVYGWKHTAIVHDMMKGINGYDISHRARHGSSETTEDYKRDYDITLNRVYSAEDLKF